jgi:DnaJ-class molecular chaperone
MGRDSKIHLLAVKGAHDVLFDPLKRQAYDFTMLDDGFPNERAKMMTTPTLLYKDDDFTERMDRLSAQLRFDDAGDPCRQEE